jgi:tRNA pseudouridine13 synthase
MGPPLMNAHIRTQAEDFQVRETLGFELNGEGEHHYLLVEKSAQNTRWVAQKLADFAFVEPQQVGYAGMKDRHAVARQWFSVPVAPNTDWSSFQVDGISILSSSRHSKKLKIGQLEFNEFQIRLRQVQADQEKVEVRLRQIAKSGVPNFYGQQRFGQQAMNLLHAEHMFTQRKRPPKWRLYLSAARSFIFNEVLAQRIRMHNWSLRVDPSKTEGQNTGPLWGRGRAPVDEALQVLEQQVATQHAVLIDGLEHAGLQQDRRLLALNVEQLQWQWQKDSLILKFRLPSGGYALSVLRELGMMEDLSLAEPMSGHTTTE